MIEGKTSPYHITAAMTYETAAELLALGTSLVNRGPVVLDLAGVPEVDSSALAVILGWQRAVGQGQLSIANPPASIHSLAALYGIDDIIAQPPPEA